MIISTGRVLSCSLVTVTSPPEATVSGLRIQNRALLKWELNMMITT